MFSGQHAHWYMIEHSWDSSPWIDCVSRKQQMRTAQYSWLLDCWEGVHVKLRRWTEHVSVVMVESSMAMDLVHETFPDEAGAVGLVE